MVSRAHSLLLVVALAPIASACEAWDEEGPPRTAAELYAQGAPRVAIVQGGPVAAADYGETFPEAFAASESVRPRPERPASISLGYVGDTPLTGGVVRDTPLTIEASGHRRVADVVLDGAGGGGEPNRPCLCNGALDQR